MQVERPEEGTYMMPMAWYFAPVAAKTMRGFNAFTSGTWDRDKPALPPLLGNQPPYNSPYYNGKNVWEYDGKCRLGTDEQWAEGLRQADLDLPIPVLPMCCGGDCPPFIPPEFTCAFLPMGCETRLSLQVVAPDPSTFPFPELLVPVLLHCTADCNYLGYVTPTPDTAIAQWFFDSGPFGATGGFQAFTIFDYCHFATGPLNAFPRIGTVSGGFSGPMGTALSTCTIVIDTFPPSPPMQTITLAGDVVGSAVLGPTGCLIANALVNIVVAGGAGDATHVPQISWDAQGRIVSVTNVAIASSAVAIGDAIGGSTANCVLFVDGAGNLADSTNIQWTGAALVITGQVQANSAGITAGQFNDGAGHVVQLATGGSAAIFTDAVNTLTLCDGTNAIGYSPATPTDWIGPAPSDALKGIDRLAAWMQANFPGLPKP